MSDKLIVNWDEYNNTVEKLAIQIEESSYKPTILIGIMRGAAPMIDVLSRIFKLKCASFKKKKKKCWLSFEFFLFCDTCDFRSLWTLAHYISQIATMDSCSDSCVMLASNYILV